MKNADMPAMPLAEPEIWVDSFDPSKGTTEAHGLTKREDFAKAAMQGYTAAGSNGMPSPEEIARLSVATADALLDELERTS
ncbi:hypothetical protein [Litchfieldella xinjiangensis]|uniref:hypothetical protein n=1 Tax=Litchfieldella xinjiangensis TaxID=1166948 RepID=UPI0005BDA645|nr:hypothetical protein [Halomonas xinjiangensis]